MSELDFQYWVLPLENDQLRHQTLLQSAGKAKVTRKVKESFRLIITLEIKLQQLLHRFKEYAPDIYGTLAQNSREGVTASNLNEFMGSNMASVFRRLDIMKDYAISYSHFCSAILAIGDPEETFSGEDNQILPHDKATREPGHMHHYVQHQDRSPDHAISPYHPQSRTPSSPLRRSKGKAGYSLRVKDASSSKKKTSTTKKSKSKKSKKPDVHSPYANHNDRFEQSW